MACLGTFLFDKGRDYRYCGDFRKKVYPIGHFSMPNGAVPARFLSKSYLL